MGKLIGILPIKGTVGVLCFARTQFGIIVKKQSSLTAERVATDPAFQRTRENSSEFGRVSRASSLLRKAFYTAAHNAMDNRVKDRLISRLHDIMKTDHLNERGKRTPMSGDLTLLQGFQFNKHRTLESVLLAPLTPAIDKTTGTFLLDLPSFIPRQALRPPKKATHYRLILGAASIHFDQHQATPVTATTAVLPINHQPTGPITLSATITPTGAPMILSAGIEFYQHVNGAPYLLDDHSRNTHAILKLVR